MAVKKSGKSSKTAHILNVLSSDQSEMAGGGEGSLAAEFPPVSDEVLAAAIRESLVQDIQQEEGGSWLPTAPDDQEEAPEQEEEPPDQEEEPPDQEEEPSDQNIEVSKPKETVLTPPQESLEDDVKEEPPLPPETPETEPAAQLSAEKPLPDPCQPAQKPGDTDPCQGRNFCYVNVMEALMEEKAPKYIKMFGVCSCARCVSDVKALALTNLPPKYAVMEKGHVVPMLTVYEGRYSTALTAQIISACKQVMMEPRH